MKIKILIISLLFTSFLQAEEMTENKYEIILNNEDSHTSDTKSYEQNEIDNIHIGLKDKNEIILKNEINLFEKCIKKSNNLINILDRLKELPSKERIIVLYKSNYWKSLSEDDKTNTLLILSKIETISESQYIIIKGKIAEIFKEECSSLNKKQKTF